MKTFSLLLTLVNFIPTLYSAQNFNKNVLFIGNSYTESNNLPLLVKNIAQSTGDNINYDSNLIGGATLQMHASNATTHNKIQAGHWDYVVLQDQSQVPSFPDAYVQNNVYPYAAALDQLINTYNPCAETLFYMTWGRKNGDTDNCPTYPAVCTYEGMDDLLRTRYLYMANTNNALVSPVGAVWRAIRAAYPNLNLYESDESHPNIAGSYAAALTFYTTIFRKNPEQTTFVPNNIDANDADRIKQIVKTVVFDQLTVWNIGKYNTKAQFTTTQSSTNPLSYQFQNMSSYADSYLWNFGDGSTSTDTHPTHTYNSPGIYTVQLTASRCGVSAVYTTTIDTNALSTLEVAKSPIIKIYPNPTQDILTVKTKEKIREMRILDASGHLLKTIKNVEIIDVHELTKGSYLLNISFENKEEFNYKFIKS